jgi:hypothetical protein
MRFIGTKTITAESMTRAAYVAFRGWQLPADEDGADEGYLVEYEPDAKPNVLGRAGYVTWTPKRAFDAAYRPCTAMTFGLALEALKRGARVARAGWNGKGMFVYLVPAASYPVQTGAAKAHFGEGSMVPYNAYLALKGADDTVSTWAPSGSDALAEDWLIVEAVASTVAPHQQRVIDEKRDLDEKLAKLEAVFDTPIFAGLEPAEQQRLHDQAVAMHEYANILADRVDAFAPVAASDAT